MAQTLRPSEMVLMFSSKIWDFILFCQTAKCFVLLAETSRDPKWRLGFNFCLDFFRLAKIDANTNQSIQNSMRQIKAVRELVPETKLLETESQQN